MMHLRIQLDNLISVRPEYTTLWCGVLHSTVRAYHGSLPFHDELYRPQPMYLVPPDASEQVEAICLVPDHVTLQAAVRASFNRHAS